MANINNYLQWRGDVTLEERPFNDVDNIILSALVYLDFTGIVAGEESGERITLRQACKRFLDRVDNAGGDIIPYVRSVARVDTRFVRLIGESQRFGSAQLCAYVDVIDQKRALQFAALQINLSNGETYVAYRGTDSTIVGWREDFMLSFTVTEAQRSAAAYLQRVFGRTEKQGRTLRVGGHSKGGNLAEYAATCCSDEQQKRIIRVYSNDGPEMAPEVMPRDPHDVLGIRLKHIVPSYSVIGMLFARPDDQRIIAKSKAVGIGQHDLMTWQVLHTGVEEALELQPDCVVLNEAIARWAQAIPLDERERVTNEVFDALQVGGATRFEEIAASPVGLQKVLGAFGNTDSRTQELAVALVEGTVGTSMNAVRSATRSAIDQWRRGAQEMASDAARVFQAAGRDIKVPMSAIRSNRRR